jgi:ribosomal-protein-alanine N-acetyltransferase
MTLRAAPPEDAVLLARLHARAFEYPWSEAEIAGLMASPGVFALTFDGRGFILVRAIAGEAEILTLAVTPDARRDGLGRALVEAAAGLAATLHAEAMFLEVASDNFAALALYEKTGFSTVGTRRGYYASGADALVMRRPLNT